MLRISLSPGLCTISVSSLWRHTVNTVCPAYNVKADGILISTEVKEIAVCFRKYTIRGLNIRMMSVFLQCE